MVLPPKQVPELPILLGDSPEMKHQGLKHSRGAILDAYAVLLEPLGIESLERLPHLKPNGSKNVLHGHGVLLVLQGDVGRDGAYGMQHTFSQTNNDYNIKHPTMRIIYLYIFTSI
jgi:hypothetical protein